MYKYKRTRDWTTRTHHAERDAVNEIIIEEMTREERKAEILRSRICRLIYQYSKTDMSFGTRMRPVCMLPSPWSATRMVEGKNLRGEIVLASLYPHTSV